MGQRETESVNVKEGNTGPGNTTMATMYGGNKGNEILRESRARK